MAHRVFGRNPAGRRLQRIRQSPHYKDGAFVNLSPTPVMAEDASFWKTLREFINKPKDSDPARPLPGLAADFAALAAEDPALAWFGHSSYFLRVGGKNILVDPVLSDSASPVPFMIRGYKGTRVMAAGDLPDIDLLILTHDHYDHLDYRTILALKARTGRYCTALGVGSHLEYWGVDPEHIAEFDWWEEREVFPGLVLTATPARHFSGRGLRRGKTLWTSFVLSWKDRRLFLGGDSGYDRHFSEIGKRFGPFDLAILEAGQYNRNWPHIHMMPEETVQAACDLRASVLLPVHWGKFSLALHPWDEPIRRVSTAASRLGVQLTTPRIGETVAIGRRYPASAWWEKM
jgi:L-ascorbate metabolism protein UlaG (beta-lactamase superfamily)